MSLPPGPRLPPILTTLWYLARPIGFFESCYRRYGDCFTVRSAVFGTEVCVCQPSAVKQVFTGDPEVLRAGEANVTLLPVVGDRSVLLLDGREHLRHRRLLLPPFHGERMAAYADVMRDVTLEITGRWSAGDRVVLRPTAQRITLEVILRTVFGARAHSDLDPMRAALLRLLDVGGNRLGSLAMIPALQRDLGPLTPWGAFVRARSRVDELIFQLIAARRAERASGAARGDDVLSVLLEATDEDGKGMTDRELRDQLITLLVAGHETTATALCWLFEGVLGQPEIHARVLAELGDVVGDGSLRAEHLPRLAYLDAAIKEALRLWPVIPAVARKLAKPETIAGYDLPAGVMIVPCVLLTHRLESLYPEPERFLPERFLDKKPDPNAWLPFGGGIRRCIGMAFALFEMKVVAATLLLRHRLQLARPGPVDTRLRGITHAPASGTRLTVLGAARAFASPPCVTTA